jgi:hypothetical protein
MRACPGVVDVARGRRLAGDRSGSPVSFGIFKMTDLKASSGLAVSAGIVLSVYPLAGLSLRALLLRRVPHLSTFSGEPWNLALPLALVLLLTAVVYDPRGNCKSHVQPLPHGRGSETTTAYRPARVSKRSFGEFCNYLPRLSRTGRQSAVGSI